MEDIHTLSRKVYSEPTGKELCPFVVEYIHHYVDKAKELSQDELLHEKGSDYASNICGALAWQGATGVTGENWITEIDEPVLLKILDAVAPLDVDPGNPEKWLDLFRLTEKL